MSEMTEVELAALLKTRDESWKALCSAMDLYRDSLAAYERGAGDAEDSVSGISEPVGPKPSSE